MNRHALAGLLACPLEHQPDVPLGLADYLFSSFRALDVEEEALAFLAFPRVLAGLVLLLGLSLLAAGRPAASAVRFATCLASELATALAISVLPHPGGPYSRTPLGGRSWCSRNRSACRYGSSTASLIWTIWELRRRCRSR